MRLLTEIRPLTVLVTVCVAGAASVLLAYYSRATPGRETTYFASPPALAAEEPPSRLRDVPVSANGRVLKITAEFSSLSGGSVAWVDEDGGCEPRAAVRQEGRASFRAGQTATKTWVVCVTRDLPGLERSETLWHPVARGEAPIDGEIAALTQSDGSTLFAAVAGSCDEVSGECRTSFQLGTTRHPRHVSLSLESSSGTRDYFVRTPLTTKAAPDSEETDAEWVELGSEGSASLD